MKHEYRELKIWQKARSLNLDIYNMTITFPKEEKYELASQMKRCSVSIVSNIAEGSAFDSASNFKRYLSIALGSLVELETQLFLASDIGYISLETLEVELDKTDHFKRMIISFAKSLN